MEALAAASGVAGILGLTGQILTAAFTLRGFFQDVASADDTMNFFLRDTNTLIQVLQEVQDVCNRVSKTLINQNAEISVDSLQNLLEDCSSDIHEWVAIARRYYISDTSGVKTAFKKFLAAANKSCVTGCQIRMQVHCRHIACSLQIIGRGFDIASFTTLQSINAKTDAFAGFSQWLEKQSLTYQEDLNNASEVLSSISGSSDEILSTSIENSFKLDNLEERSKSTEDRLERIEQLLIRSSRKQSRSPSSLEYFDMSSDGIGFDALNLDPENDSTLRVTHKAETTVARAKRIDQKPNSRNKGKLATTVPTAGPYKSMSDWIYTLYPKPVADYLANIHHMSFIEQQLRLLEREIRLGSHSQGGRRNGVFALPFAHDGDELSMASAYMRAELMSVQDYVQSTRQSCVLDGINLYELERLLELDQGKLKAKKSNRSHPKQKAYISQHPKSSATSGIYQSDFMNSWLLGVLLASDEAIALHRSFLPDPTIDQTVWIQQVSTYWWVDGTSGNEADVSLTDKVLQSDATRSAFTSGSGGALLSAELKGNIASGWNRNDFLNHRTAGNFLNQLPDRYRCLHCDAVMAETDRYLEHLTRHKENLPYHCAGRGCPRIFKQHHELRYHMDVHSAIDAVMASEDLMAHVAVKPELASYIISIQKLSELLKTNAQYQEQHREARKKTRNGAWIPGQQKHLRTNEIAICAVQLATSERVDLAWRKMHAIRWRMLQKHLLPSEWMTPSELRETELRKTSHRQRITYSVEEIVKLEFEAEMDFLKGLKRKGSCPARLQSWGNF